MRLGNKNSLVIGIIAIFIVMGVTGLKLHKNELVAGLCEMRADGLFVAYSENEEYYRLPLPDRDLKMLRAPNTSWTAFVSRPRIAVTYCGMESGASLEPVLMITTNEGKHWTYAELPEEYDSNRRPPSFGNVFLGFSSTQEGWLVCGSAAGLGTEYHDVFLTHDGGVSWEHTSSPDEQYRRVMTSAAFANKNNGFIAFRFDGIDPAPVYATYDAGRNWKLIAFPETPYYIEKCFAKSIRFSGQNGTIVFEGTTFDGEQRQISFYSHDYGRSWSAQ